MKSYQLLIALLFACTCTFAQTNSFQGFYITTGGEKVSGTFPGYKQWNNNPSTVQFVTSAGSGSVILTPDNTKSFTVQDFDEYIAFKGSRLVNPIDDYILLNMKAYNNSADSMEKVATFLRVIAKSSSAALFALNDDKRTNFYFQLSGQPIQELRYKKIYESGSIHEDLTFRQQLGNAFSSIILKKHLTAELQELGYKEEELVKFFHALFSDIQIENKQKKIPASWYIAAGVSINSIKVDEYDNVSYVPRSYKSNSSPLVSAGVYFPLGRNFGKYYINPQIQFFKYQAEGEELMGGYLVNNKYEASLVITGQLGIGIKLINKKDFALSGEIDAGILIQSNGKQTRQKYNVSDHSSFGYPEYSTLRSGGRAVGGTISAFIRNRFILSAGYMIPGSINNNVYYTPTLSALQLKLGVRL